MWSVLVHGGAKSIARGEEEANRCGCLAAASAAAKLLAAGATSVEAVEAAVRILEDDPTFNAGRGSVVNEDGDIEMSAGLMEGRALNVGAVGAIRAVPHPVSVARALLYDKPVLLVAEGARRYAAEHGVALCEAEDLIAEAQLATDHDTVGAVALDVTGSLAVAVSTGGLTGKAAGRVGDSPQPGCGYYAEDGVGAVALSGDGEEIARAIAAARILHGVRQGAAARAVEEGLALVSRLGGEAGAILVLPDGSTYWDHTSSHFAVGGCSSSAPEPKAWLTKVERSIG